MEKHYRGVIEKEVHGNPTLVCSKCGNKHIYYKVASMKGISESRIVLPKCPDCGHKLR